MNDDFERKIKDTQEYLNKFSKYIDTNFLIPGGEKTMTIRDWRAYFFIKIPKDITPPILVELSQDLIYKYQEACTYRDQHLSKMTIISHIKDEKYHLAYQDARTENERKFNKPLSAESCRTQATLAIKDLDDAISSQKAIKDFWDRTCSILIETRKIIEMMGRAISSEIYAQKEITFK